MSEKILSKDFEEATGESLSELVKEKISECEFVYEKVTWAERDKLISVIVDYLLEEEFIVSSGPHRITDWIKGWGENHAEFSDSRDFNSLIPKYFGKHPYVRWQGEWIKPCNKDFEYNMVRVLQYWLFEKFFSSCDNIYEFGCGTGHNLFRAQEINESASITGLDWATSSQEAIKEINKIYGFDFKSHKFDFYNVDNDFVLGDTSGVYTFAALEQIGDNYYDFIDYLIKNNPSTCVHVEPMAEYLDDSSICDYLSIKYFEKRKYLSGFAKHLKALETEGKIEIIYEKRSFIGSVFINGYSIIAWRSTNA